MSRWILFVALSLVVWPMPASAGQLYSFLETGTGNVLATMDIQQLPAYAPNVNYFEFTPLGLAWLDSQFANNAPAVLRSKLFFNAATTPQTTVIDDGVSGLRSGSDETVSFVRFEILPFEYNFNIYFQPRSTPAAWLSDATDSLDLVALPDEGPMMASVSGNWVRSAVVPEPSTGILAGLGLVGLARRRRR